MPVNPESNKYYYSGIIGFSRTGLKICFKEQVSNDVRNKHIIVYFLGADLMLGVEVERHANRDRIIIIDHDIVFVKTNSEITAMNH
jgi:hypothetical protein